MAEEQASELTRLLSINSKTGEITNRYDWRSAFENVFQAQPPKISWLRYEQACKERGELADINEWLKLAGVQP